MLDLRRFRLFGSMLLGLAFLAAFAATLGMDGSLQYPLGYSQVLILLTGLLFFSAMALAWQERAVPKMAIEAARQGTAGGATVLGGIIVLCIAYVLSWDIIGYFPATFLFVATQLWLLQQRSWPILLGVPSAATLLVYVVFYRVLQLPFPMGVFQR
jgi:hypothetical protein